MVTIGRNDEESKTMLTTTLNLRVSPRRMLKTSEAAEYCGMSAAQFKACPVTPVDMSGAGKRFDMVDLDNWLDALKGHHVVADEMLARLD